MTYIHNADLTPGHIKYLAGKCGYDWIDPTPGRGLVCAVKTPSGEIVEFTSLPHARRFLNKDLKEIEGERKRACRQLGIHIAISTLPYYYEHLLDPHGKFAKVAAKAASIYFRVYHEHHTILGHHVENINGTSVLIFWTPNELRMDQQRDFDHDWEPTRSIYNLKHNQSLAAFQAWYEAVDEQTRFDYWNAKRSNWQSGNVQQIGSPRSNSVEHSPD